MKGSDSMSKEDISFICSKNIQEKDQFLKFVEMLCGGGLMLYQKVMISAMYDEISSGKKK